MLRKLKWHDVFLRLWALQGHQAHSVDSQVLTKPHKRLSGLCYPPAPPMTFLTIWLSVPFSCPGQFLRRRCAPATGLLHRLPFCLKPSSQIPRVTVRCSTLSAGPQAAISTHRSTWSPFLQHSTPPYPHYTPAFCLLPVSPTPGSQLPGHRDLGPCWGPHFHTGTGTRAFSVAG